MITHRLIISLAAAAFVAHAADVRAQGAFPAPLPGQAAAPAGGSSPFPPVGGRLFSVPAGEWRNWSAYGGSASFAKCLLQSGAPPIGGGGFGGAPAGGPPPGAEECQNGFLPLRKDAEAKAKLI